MQVVRITNKVEGYDEHGRKILYPISASASDEILNDIKYNMVHFTSIAKSSYPGFYELTYMDTTGEKKYIAELKGDIVDMLFVDKEK